MVMLHSYMGMIFEKSFRKFWPGTKHVHGSALMNRKSPRADQGTKIRFMCNTADLSEILAKSRASREDIAKGTR